MGCTSSKTTPSHLASSPSPADEQLLISESFRTWLKGNRRQAEDELLLAVGDEEQRTLLSKALDLLLEHPEIRTTNKWKKLIQKEVKSASSKQVTQIVDSLQQAAAEKQRPAPVAATERSEEKLFSSPGISLKEALETARISFYKVERSCRASVRSASLPRANKRRSSLIRAVATTCEFSPSTTTCSTTTAISFARSSSPK